MVLLVNMLIRCGKLLLCSCGKMLETAPKSAILPRSSKPTLAKLVSPIHTNSLTVNPVSMNPFMVINFLWTAALSMTFIPFLECLAGLTISIPTPPSFLLKNVFVVGIIKEVCSFSQYFPIKYVSVFFLHLKY